MKTRSIVAGAVLMSLAAAPALAGYGHPGNWEQESHHAFTDRARVVDVDPIHEAVRVPTRQRECWEEEAYHSDGGDVRSGEGLIAGSIIGGVIGSQVGKGDGRKAATIVGTILGAAVGHDMAKGSNGARPYPTTETRCQVKRDWYEEDRIVGYRVTYRYQGHTYTRRMERDPGRWVDVRVDVTPY